MDTSDDRVILSICIPTYNRVDDLCKTIESIILQAKDLKDRIEVIVSDNCSTDETESIMNEYCKAYEFIHYYRNEKNILGLNFAAALKRGTGIYRKLINDTVNFNNDSLSKMISIIKEHSEDRPVLFWDNNNSDSKFSPDIDGLLYRCSYGVTWIGSLGIWEDEADYTEQHCKLCAEEYGGSRYKWRKEEAGQDHFWQVRYLFDGVVKKSGVLIVGAKDLFYSRPVKKHFYKGYISELFGQYYVSLLKEYLEKGKISQDCFCWEKRDLALNFLLYYVLEYEYGFGTNEFEGDIKTEVFQLCENEPYYGDLIREYKKKKLFYYLKRKKNDVKKLLKME